MRRWRDTVVVGGAAVTDALMVADVSVASPLVVAGHDGGRERRWLRDTVVAQTQHAVSLQIMDTE